MNLSCSLRGILVAEDDTAARNAMHSVLAMKYPEAVIYTAEDGRAGLELFRRHRPEMVITDLKMPDMDGLQMAREILKEKVDTRVIVVTGYLDMPCSDDSALREIGVDAVLWKPLDFRQLFAAITDCM